MYEASKSLALAEAGAKQQGKQVKTTIPGEASNQYAAGLEWDVIATDATVLLAVTQALSESYLGYAKCLYSLNKQVIAYNPQMLFQADVVMVLISLSSAHSRFTSMYKIVFPNGIDEHSTPTTSRGSSRTDLVVNKQMPERSFSKDSSLSTAQSSLMIPFGMLSRWIGGSSSTVSVSRASSSPPVVPNNAIDHLIFSGVAFGSF